jgi:hypothetical protein
MKTLPTVIDVRQSKERRRFYLERARRRPAIGAGSDLRFLMGNPRREIVMSPSDVFGDLAVMVIGGVATRAYAPERHTDDIDFFVQPQDYAEALRRLAAAGFRKRCDLLFPNATLGLYGEAWSRERAEVDVISTPQDWAVAAFEGRSEDQTGLRVIPLPYLVLMKLDSARGIDQGDLTRMLGRLDSNEVERICEIVTRYSGDASLADDTRQYAELGRWELQTESPRDRADDSNAP